MNDREITREIRMADWSKIDAAKQVKFVSMFTAQWCRENPDRDMVPYATFEGGVLVLKFESLMTPAELKQILAA